MQGRCCRTCVHFVPRDAIISELLTEAQYSELEYEENLEPLKEKLIERKMAKGVCFYNEELKTPYINNQDKPLSEKECTVWEG